MAGTIEVASGTSWSAATWLFKWVLKTVASDIENVETAASLVGIADENLGWLSLDTLTVGEKDQIRLAITTRLLEHARREFLATIPNGDGVLQHLQSLVVLVDRAV